MAQPAPHGGASGGALPFEVLVSILGRVAQEHRLGSCALVSSTWARAAAAASSSIEAWVRDEASGASLSRYLRRHAGHVQELDVQGNRVRRPEAGPGAPPERCGAELAPAPPTLRLPLAQLCSLRVLCASMVRLGVAATPAAATGQRAAAGTAAAPPAAEAQAETPGGGACSAGATGCSCHARGPAQLLPCLTQLDIDEGLHELMAVLQGQASTLRGLRTLQLRAASPWGSPAAAPGDTALLTREQAAAANTAAVALLGHAAHLQRLRCECGWLQSSSLQPLSALSQLQQLELRLPANMRPEPLGAWLQHVRSEQLTLLDLSQLVPSLLPAPGASRVHRAAFSPGVSIPLTGASVGHLTSFASLARLVVARGAGLDPALLSHFPALTHLELADATLARRLSHAGAAATLAALPRLRQLRHLRLGPDLLQPPAADAGAYSALTASSSHLTHLALYRCPLPPGAAQAMFPSGSGGGAAPLLPGLRTLRLAQLPAGGGSGAQQQQQEEEEEQAPAGAAAAAAEGDGDGGSGADGGVSAAAAAVGQPPLASGLCVADIVGSCPGLAQLSLTVALPPGRGGSAAAAAAAAAADDLLHVTRLPGLTQLQLDGDAVDDALAARLLVRLTALRQLDLHVCPGLTDAGLARLTALRGLTSLQARGCTGLSAGVGGLARTVYLWRHGGGAASAGGDEPVWRSLLGLCSSSVVCLQALLAERDQQLAEAQGRLAAAEARARAAEARLAQLGAPVARDA